MRLGRTTFALALAVASVLSPSVPSRASEPAGRTQGPAQEVGWTRLDKALEASARTRKPVFVMVEAQWCGYCRRMHATSFRDAKVVDLLANRFHPALLDGESGRSLVFPRATLTESQWAAAQGVRGFPSLFVLDPKGRVLANIPGYVEARTMESFLRDVLLYIQDRGPERRIDFQTWLDSRG